MKQIFKWVGWIGLVVIVGVGVYGFYIYQEVIDTMNQIHEEVTTINLREPKSTTEETKVSHEPFSILLLGIDQDEGMRGRSDSIMVVTLNPEENSTKILSIPRDTYTEITGRGTADKINHAYAFGGAEMAINTVQNFLGIPIDYYAEIQMTGISRLVDVAGGVSVDNDLGFDYGGTNFPLGSIELNGKDAMNFMRMRYEDPRGDFGRQARQRQVIIALAHELIDVAVAGYQEILTTVGEHMRTNLTLEDLFSLSLNYRGALNDITQLQLQGTGQRINGIYYQIIPEEEVKTVTTLLREHLELDDDF